MHECVRRLLRSSSDGESLECFAKLMSTIGKEMDHDKGKVHVQGKACDTVRNWFKMSFSLCRTWWRSTSTEWVTLLRQGRLIHESGLCCRTWWTWDKWESSMWQIHCMWPWKTQVLLSTAYIYSHTALHCTLHREPKVTFTVCVPCSLLMCSQVTCSMWQYNVIISFCFGFVYMEKLNRLNRRFVSSVCLTAF